MTFIVVPQDSEPAQFYITRNMGPAAGDEPRYVDVWEGRSAEESHVLINMKPYPDGMDEVAFTVNPDPTPVTSALWGEMKALFR